MSVKDDLTPKSQAERPERAERVNVPNALSVHSLNPSNRLVVLLVA